MLTSKILNVYINRSNHPCTKVKDTISLANVLYDMTMPSKFQMKTCLEGCDVDNKDPRDLGGMFTFHLETQVNTLVKDIVNEASPSEHLTLNLYGEELGAAAVFWVCQKLKNIKNISINLCVLDPVTKNLMGTSYADNALGFKYSLAGQIADLRKCLNINTALLLYTTQSPYSAILPLMPSGATITLDVLPGNENIGLYDIFSDAKLNPKSKSSAIAFHHVTRFLKGCDVKFNFDHYLLEESLLYGDRELAQLFEIMKMEIKPHTRAFEIMKMVVKTHTRDMHFGNQIICVADQPYVNGFHREVSTGKLIKHSKGLSLSVKYPDPQPSYKNGLLSNEYVPQIAKGAGAATAVIGSAYLAYQYPFYALSLAAGCAAKTAYDFRKKANESKIPEITKVATSKYKY